MHPSERHRQIMKVVNSDTIVSVKYLQCNLDVTSMTIWRDLKYLEDQGLIKRIRGGAMKTEVQDELRFDIKVEAAKSAKVRIARHVANHLIEDGDVIALEGGTTVAALASHLTQSRLTVLTNSLPVMNLISTNKQDVTVYCSGGLLREESGTLVGKEAVTFFSRRKVRRFFMSATGFDLDLGLTDPNPMEIEVKQAMANSAKEVILLLDSGKIGQTSLMQVITLRKISQVVSEKKLPRSYKSKLKALSIPSVVVK